MLELLLDLHVLGERGGVGNGENAGVGECAGDCVAVKSWAKPQHAVEVMVLTMSNARWQLLLYIFDDVDVEVVVGPCGVLLHLGVDEILYLRVIHRWPW